MAWYGREIDLSTKILKGTVQRKTDIPYYNFTIQYDNWECIEGWTWDVIQCICWMFEHRILSKEGKHHILRVREEVWINDRRECIGKIIAELQPDDLY